MVLFYALLFISTLADDAVKQWRVWKMENALVCGLVRPGLDFFVCPAFMLLLFSMSGNAAGGDFFSDAQEKIFLNLYL
ncbi:hypothetical protein M5D96_002688 [Drosophila gunungcola]|uniref:Uncharacterized protein n=1 Tax=Drosophila gunungcola TaxID=103775 RepID=A0A9P9Z177_9MUSC|nr:hypothetical protein M5D96_002688 [Drosophila gunungcola]